MTDSGFSILDEHMEGSKEALHSYIVGFVLSVILTIVPYYMVTQHIVGGGMLIFGVVCFGVLQLLTQVYFFLHLNKRSKPRWNIIIFAFTVLIVAFLVIGTLWIMYHLNYNMMGVSPFNSNEGFIPQ